MTISKTTPLQRTGHTLTELFELGYLKNVEGGNWQGDIPAHSLIQIGRIWFCHKCGFETFKVSELRKGKGCSAS
jgi:hypothetical protein